MYLYAIDEDKILKHILIREAILARKKDGKLA